MQDLTDEPLTIDQAWAWYDAHSTDNDDDEPLPLMKGLLM